MVNLYEQRLMVMKYAPDGNRALVVLERDGNPLELVCIVGCRFWRILKRHARLGKPPLTRLEVERLAQQLLAKVCRELISFVTALGLGIDAAEARRILHLPPIAANGPSAIRKMAA